MTPGTYGTSIAVPRITVDAKGRLTAVTTQAVASGSGLFSLTNAADQDFTTGGLPLPIQFDTVVSDTLSQWDGVNHKLVVASTGIYLINFDCILYTTNTGDLAVELQVGGSKVREILVGMTFGSGDFWVPVSLTSIMSLTALDEIQLIVRIDTQYTILGAEHLRFQGFKLV